MSDLVAHYAKWTVNVRLGKRIGGGAAGDIHRVLRRPSLVAKLYRDPADRAAYERKIADMLRRPPNLPPIQTNGREYVQIAWPEALLRDQRGSFVGFLMPAIDIKAATELENVLQRAARRTKGIPESYGGRVILAGNLAALLAELHRNGDYFIDMKPVNVRFYPSTWYLAILDTDGFSIQGTRRWPAQQFSEEYIAPEAKSLSPSRLGIEQDLFALAVIIFRLLNNGVHPYQGVDVKANLPGTLQERIFAGLYAYGKKRALDVDPTPASIHESLEDSTIELFDRAFLGLPASRPAAKEWAAHLQGLINSQILRKCSRNPLEHMHFSRACGLCAFEARRGVTAVKPVQLNNVAIGAPQSPPFSSSSRNVTHSSGGGARQRTPNIPQTPPQSGPWGSPSVAGAPPIPAKKSNAGKWIGGAIVGMVLLGALLSSGTKTTTSSAGQTSVQQQATSQSSQTGSTQTPSAAPPAAVPPRPTFADVSDRDLCARALPFGIATTANDIRWDTSPAYDAHVTEAIRRGYNPKSCFALVNSGSAPPRNAPSQTSVQQQPTSQPSQTGSTQAPSAAPPTAVPPRPTVADVSDRDLCFRALPFDVATNGIRWDASPAYVAYVAEAKRRGYSAQSCYALAFPKQPSSATATPPGQPQSAPQAPKPTADDVYRARVQAELAAFQRGMPVAQMQEQFCKEGAYNRYIRWYGRFEPAVQQISGKHDQLCVGVRATVED